jgi:predicted aspartyl protease
LTLRCIAVLAVGASVSVAVPLPPPVATATAGASTSATPTSAIPLPPDSPAAPTADTAPAPGAPGNTSTEEELTPVIVTAPEPRYVAPTRRDRIGRIWAPVYINGRGPFRLVLDSGATASEITAQVANTLGLTPDMSHRVLLRGVVGSAAVPIVQVQSLTVGDLSFGHLRMPIVPDALGGADGILGTDGMGNRRILIDFNHDRITIARSHDQPAPAGYITIHFDLVRKELLVADAWVGNIRTKAIIDTGGQATIGNLALRAALERRSAQLHPAEATIEDVTRATQQANDDMEAPPIVLGTGFHGSSVQIINDELAFGDMQIFQHWNMTDEPTMLIGMDTLGRLGVLIIDYRRHELQLQLDN